MSTLPREKIAARLQQLPSLPQAVSELLSSFANDDVDVDHIARLIARDQALTARTLRVANSSFMACKARCLPFRKPWSCWAFGPCAAWCWPLV